MKTIKLGTLIKINKIIFKVISDDEKYIIVQSPSGNKAVLKKDSIRQNEIIGE